MESLPPVSIVMAVKNEREAIQACLDSIHAQDYPLLHEIIIADGNSRDGTLELLTEFAETDPRIRLLRNSKGSQTSGLNQCIRASSGEIIVRLDGHAVYAGDYISQCVRLILDTGCGCAGGGVNMIETAGFLPRLFGLVQQSPFGTGVARFRRSNYEGEVDTVWPGAYRREVLKKVGLFREYLTRTEDLDLHRRIRSAGFTIRQSPAIKPYYRPRSSLNGIIRQYFGNGRQIIETLFVNPASISLRHMIPFLWVSGLALIILASILFSPLFLLPAGLYLLLALVFSFPIARSAGIQYLLPAFMVFPIIHLSYGIGSWTGVFTSIIHFKLLQNEKSGIPAF